MPRNISKFCHNPRVLIANSEGQNIPSFGVCGLVVSSTNESNCGKGKDSVAEGSSKLDMPLEGFGYDDGRSMLL